jgi:hypothetical protein
VANSLSCVLALPPCLSEDTTVRRAISRLIVTVALGLLVVPLAANAQQPGKAYRIDVLATTSWSPFDAFR